METTFDLNHSISNFIIESKKNKLDISDDNNLYKIETESTTE
jgi:hypothetical protein